MMNYFGGQNWGSSCGCNTGWQNTYYPTFAPYGCGNYGGNSNYAIILVLFILLVIVLGSRFNN